MSTYDLICIGAGPTGLACAIEAKRAGMRPLVIDKGCLCNSLYHYPVNMVFFTTPELLEIGDLPLTIASEKPTRSEALKYYRKCAEHYELDLRLGHLCGARRRRERKIQRAHAGRAGNSRAIRRQEKLPWPPVTTTFRIGWEFREKICRTVSTTTRSRTLSGAEMW